MPADGVHVAFSTGNEKATAAPLGGGTPALCDDARPPGHEIRAPSSRWRSFARAAISSVSTVVTAPSETTRCPST